jgi:hypothetical protein
MAADVEPAEVAHDAHDFVANAARPESRVAHARSHDRQAELVAARFRFDEVGRQRTDDPSGFGIAFRAPRPGFRRHDDAAGRGAGRDRWRGARRGTGACRRARRNVEFTRGRAVSTRADAHHEKDGSGPAMTLLETLAHFEWPFRYL